MGARAIPQWPRMMRRSTAALYCDLTSAGFEREVAAGRLPLPVGLDGEDHWSREQIDESLDRLTGAKSADWRANSPVYAAR